VLIAPAARAAASTLSAGHGRQVAREAASRAARVTAAIRLAESVADGASGRRGGAVKGEDPLFVSALQGILAAAGAAVQRADAAGAAGAVDAAVVRGAAGAAGEGCAGVIKMLVAERGIAGKAEEARASVAGGDGEGGAAGDVLKSDLLIEETSQVRCCGPRARPEGVRAGRGAALHQWRNLVRRETWRAVR